MLGFFKDSDGQFSATRLAFLAWAIGVLAVWIGNNIRPDRDKPFQLDTQVVYILGILMTGKVTQAFAENQDGKSGAKQDRAVAGAAIGAAAGAGAAAGVAAGTAVSVAPPHPEFTSQLTTPDGKTVSIKDGVVISIT